MATSSWREPPPPAKPAPREARCSACGGWIGTAPAGTKWLKGRCGNRRCQKYNEGQTVHLRDSS